MKQPNQKRVWQLALMALCLVIGVGQAVESSAQVRGPRLGADEFTGGRQIRQLFQPVAARVGASVVWVTDGSRDLALATVVGDDGLALTKASEVVDQKLSARLSGGRTAEVALLGVDSANDLALIRIDAEGLVPFSLQRRSSTQVGDWLITAGPAGEVVAVGVKSVPPRRIAPQPGVMGIEMGEPNEGGVPIGRIFENSGAEVAGLKAGDVVTHINNQRVRTRENLASQVRRFGPGDSISVRFMRGEESMELSVRLSGQVTGMSLSRGDLMNRMGGALSDRAAGFPSALAHDTVLTPRQTGGPLINLDGELVGVNIARSGRTESLAIPAERLQSIVRSLLRNLQEEAEPDALVTDDETDLKELAEGSAEDETKPVHSDSED